MLQVFRTNQLVNCVFFLLYAGILHSYAFFFPFQQPIAYTGLWNEVLFNWLGSGSFLSAFFTYCLVVLQATLISWISLTHRISHENTLFAGVFYILLSSMSVYFLNLSPCIVANTFLIFALINHFYIFRQPNCNGYIFNIGFFIAFASFFDASYSFMLIAFLLGIVGVRTFSFRELSILLIGFFTAYYLVGAVYYITGNWEYFVTGITQGITWSYSFEFNHEYLVTTVALFLVLLYILWSYNSFQFGKNMQPQKLITFLYTTIFISIFSLFFQTNVTLHHLLWAIVPLSMLLSISFADAEKKEVASGIHVLMFACIIAFHYYRVFF